MAYVAFPKVSLLGRRVDALGMATPEGKIKVIAGLEFHRTLRQLETYLGMTGALRERTIEEIARLEYHRLEYSLRRL